MSGYSFLEFDHSSTLSKIKMNYPVSSFSKVILLFKLQNTMQKLVSNFRSHEVLDNLILDLLTLIIIITLLLLWVTVPPLLLQCQELEA